MAEALITTLEVPAVSKTGDIYDRDYKPSMMWDIEAGDFIRDGANKIVEEDGRKAYMAWCVKMSCTERFECLAYRGSIGDMLGAEMETATYDDDHATVESMMARTIRETLMVNPRTISVDNFAFSWDGDTVTGQCRIKAYNMDPFTMRF